MRTIEGTLFHSPTDLVRFLGCAHATALDLQKLRDPASLPDKVGNDAMTQLISQAGLAHEETYRAALCDSDDLVEIPSGNDTTDREKADLTIAAMRQGAPAIFQAAFLDAPWSV